MLAHNHVPSNTRRSSLRRRFEKMLTEREAGRSFGVFISVYHELILVMLCRLQGYTLTGADVLAWLNGDVELAMQLLLGVLKVTAYEVQLCANCIAIMLDFATPSAYFSGAGFAGGGDGSQAQHSVQDFLRHVDKLQRIVMNMGGVAVITACLARHLQVAERATLQNMGAPASSEKPVAILPAPYLRGAIHFMRFVHLLYTYAGSHAASEEQQQAAGGQSSSTVGFRQHILVTTQMAQALLIPHLRVSGLLWRFAAARGPLPAALLGGSFVRAASLVMRTLAMVSFRSVASSLPIMRTNPCTAFLDGLQAVTHSTGSAPAQLPQAAADTMFALLCCVQVNWDALAPHPPHPDANPALQQLAHQPAAAAASSGPQPIKPAQSSGPQAISSKSAASATPLSDWPVTCKPGTLAAQLKRAFQADDARRQALLHTLTAPSWMPLSRDHYSYDLLLSMATNAEAADTTSQPAASQRGASEAARATEKPQAAARVPAALKTVGITWNASTNRGSRSAAASLGPLRTPAGSSSGTPVHSGSVTGAARGDLTGASAAAARHAARERERQQREAAAAGIDLSKHQVQSSAAGSGGSYSTQALPGPASVGGRPSMPLQRTREARQPGTEAPSSADTGGEVPSEFLCALTGSIMRSPVVAQVDLSPFTGKEARGVADLSIMRRREKVQHALQRSNGVVRYEEESIRGWLQQRGSVDPLTGGELTPGMLKQDTHMQQRILEWQVASSMASQATDSAQSDSKDGQEDFDGDALYDF